MSTVITPTPGRIVWYRGADGEIRPAIVIKGNGPFNADLYVFPLDSGDPECGFKPTVTHADPVQEHGCVMSWHWMPYQKQQAEKSANEAARADEPKLPTDHPVSQIAAAGGGTVEHVARMPDGSGAATISFPLPANHWLTQPGYDEPPMGFRKGINDPDRVEWTEKIRAAGRYAVRGATMNGTEDDFDPDALVQNLIVGMLGYFTPDGLSHAGELEAPATDTSGLPG